MEVSSLSISSSLPLPTPPTPLDSRRGSTDGKVRPMAFLCLDGGGVRGLIEIEMLMELERRTGRRVNDMFDVIWGTSTGGILASAIRSGLPLATIRLLYQVFPQRVFPQVGWNIFKGVGRLWRWLARGAWYDAAPLKTLLAGFLLADQRRLNEDTWTTGAGRPRLTVRPFAVISCLFHNSAPRVHANYGDATQRSSETLMTVLRATSAAPAFFPPEVIKSETHVDGGCGNNNPSLLCFERHHESLAGKDFVWVSLGTGSGRQVEVGASFMLKEIASRFLVKSVTDGERHHQFLHTVLTNGTTLGWWRARYYRLQPTSVQAGVAGPGVVKLDETSTERLNDMVKLTRLWITANESLIAACAAALM